MKTQEKTIKTVIEKIVSDKERINEQIRKGGDLSKLKGITFVKHHSL